ncbi:MULTISPECIES: MerR family transcriptional regulator [unclassified Ruegeria]|uniref:MerR family transcriptional regulator n=1 Tax=unclassified Ruegeria TaxID=2625375 RepID=UPI001AE5B98B|nr:MULTISPECIES: MerR family transcriptional regulator [unclassified Ruegeria]
MSKSPDAFRTISEVADWLGVQAHVLRFWESRFAQVKPVKRAGGRRYYRPNDMRLLGGIKKLLHEDGTTIKGVQRILREQGVAHVAALSPPLDEPGPALIEPVQGTVVPFEPKPAAATEQIPMDLDGPSEQPANECMQADARPTAVSVQEPDLNTAPLIGGIASLAWKRAEFDDELLRQIAPIAKDLRRWLDRVETQATG